MFALKPEEDDGGESESFQHQTESTVLLLRLHESQRDLLRRSMGLKYKHLKVSKQSQYKL